MLTRKESSRLSGLFFLNQTTYYKIQRSPVVPTIHEHYAINIEQARKEVQDTNKIVLVDSHFDSPGKYAKYCTYSLQLPITKKIIASVTLQKDSGKGSALSELKRLQECLQDLPNVGCTITVIATDRNREIAKWIRQELSENAHKFDPWHFVKNIKCKFRPLSQRKYCRVISDWIKAIGKHLFWCCSSCDKDAETLVQMWKSQMSMSLLRIFLSRDCSFGSQQ